jgi:hypothetical protein
VSINLLKQVYAATHPAAQMKPRDRAAAAELLASLDAEDDEDEEVP